MHFGRDFFFVDFFGEGLCFGGGVVFIQAVTDTS